MEILNKNSLLVNKKVFTLISLNLIWKNKRSPSWRGRGVLSEIKKHLTLIEEGYWKIEMNNILG